MASRKLWPWLIPLLLPGSALGANAARPFRVTPSAPLAVWEQRLYTIPVHNSEFADVPHSNARSRCERTHPPEALATPNPVLNPGDPSFKVRVSFIVGADGRVHSPLILESAGTADDQAILDAVRSWRYRPAMCNGVPTETEGRIEFSRR
jgi:TonB family protein